MRLQHTRTCMRLLSLRSDPRAPQSALRMDTPPPRLHAAHALLATGAVPQLFSLSLSSLFCSGWQESERGSCRGWCPRAWREKRTLVRTCIRASHPASGLRRERETPCVSACVVLLPPSLPACLPACPSSHAPLLPSSLDTPLVRWLLRPYELAHCEHVDDRLFVFPK